MRILFFTELYYRGGLYNFLSNLIAHWPKGDELIFLCNVNMPGIPELQARWQGKCKIVLHQAGIGDEANQKLPSSRLARKASNFIKLTKQYLGMGYHVLYFKALLQQYQPDRVMIINGGYPGGYTCRAMALTGLFAPWQQKPLFNYHNAAVPAHKLFWPAEALLDRLIEKSVSALVTVSADTQTSLKVRPALAASEKHQVIFNGLPDPPALPGQPTLKEELALPPSSQIILMLATLEERKGHDFMLKALEEILEQRPDCHLVLAGQGSPDEEANLKAKIARQNLGAKVHFLGYRQDVPRLIQGCDLLVMPSQRNESFGLTLVEAFQLQKPVVATRIGGMPEVVVEGQGGLLAELDPVDFARQCLRFLQDPAFAQEQGKLGLARYRKHFTIKRMVSQYHQLLHDKG